MTTIKSNFETLAGATVPTVGNTNFTQVTVGTSNTLVTDATITRNGATSSLKHAVVTTNAQFCEWSIAGAGFGAGLQRWFRLYVYFASLPAQSVTLGGFLTSGFGNLMSVRLDGATHKFQIFDASGLLVTSTTVAASSGRWIRLEGTVLPATVSTGQANLLVYQTSPDGIGPDDAIRVSTGNFGTIAPALHFTGIINGASAGSFNVSNVAFSDTAAIGPDVSTITVAVDWAKSGSFTDSIYDDVSAVVRGTVTATYGRDQVTALSPIVAGRAGFELDNITRNYSPLNVSSPLFGNLKPARPVRVQRTVGPNVYTVFRGHTDDNPISPDVDNKRVAISCVDSLADFRGLNISTPLYQGIRSGQAIGYILDAAAFTGGRDIDSGGSTFSWWWEEGTDAFDALQKVLYSEGSPALLTIDATGAVVFRDRHHRLVRSASTVSQSTWRGTGTVEPVMAPGFLYSGNWQNVVNYLSFSVDERRLSDIDTVWSTDDLISLSISEVRTYVVQTTDPFMGALTPVNGTDMNVTSGSLSSVSISRTSGAATSITLTAGGSGATLADGLRLRAQALPVVRTYQLQATDSGSITDYGQRSLPSGQEPVWASVYDAQGIANLLILQRAQPLPLLNVRFSCQHTQTTRLNGVLAADLSDRVTVVEAETSVNGPFFVESISHNISSMVNHEITIGLESAPASPASAFILDTSLLDGVSPLGY